MSKAGLELQSKETREKIDGLVSMTEALLADVFQRFQLCDLRIAMNLFLKASF